MSFLRKVDRAMEAQRKINESMRPKKSPYDEDDDVKLEKHDFLAMWMAAATTIFLPAAGVLALLGLIAYLLIPR